MIEVKWDGVLLYRGNTAHDPCRLNEAASEFFEKTGLPPQNVLKMPSGKPYFPKGTWHLSPAHTGEEYAVAFAPYPIGLDLERDEVKKERVAEKYFTEEEKKLPFSLVWTAKEAVSKISGEGLSAVGKIHLSGDGTEAEKDGEKYEIFSVVESGVRTTLARRKRNQ